MGTACDKLAFGDIPKGTANKYCASLEWTLGDQGHTHEQASLSYPTVKRRFRSDSILKGQSAIKGVTYEKVFLAVPRLDSYDHRVTTASSLLHLPPALPLLPTRNASISFYTATGAFVICEMILLV